MEQSLWSRSKIKTFSALFIFLLGGGLSAKADSRQPAPGFYVNSEQTPVFTLVRDAKKTLDIEIYQMEDADFRQAIRNALKRKVRVRVIKEPDPNGDPCKIFEANGLSDEATCLDQKKLKSEIIASGGSYIPYNKNEFCPSPHDACFLHGKMVVADGYLDNKIVLLSTGNFNSSNLCNLKRNPKKCNRDFSMVEQDPKIVDFLQKVFEKDLQAKKYDLKSMMDKGKIGDRLTISPYSEEPLVRLIDGAKKSIRLENQYVYEHGLVDALTRASRRGVKVDMIVASLCSFGYPKKKDVKKDEKLFGEYDDAGVHVEMLPTQFKINGKPGYMHAKAMAIDDQIAWVGSTNGSKSATMNNREFGMIFSNPVWVKKLNSTIQNDFKSADMETWRESIRCKKDDPDLIDR